MALWFANTKKISLNNVTVPWEEECDEAHELKSGNYKSIQQAKREKLWTFQTIWLPGDPLSQQGRRLPTLERKERR